MQALFLKPLALLLSLVQTLLASAGFTTLWEHKAPAAHSAHPYVMVPGAFGYGFDDLIDEVYPYWGMSTGSIPDDLAKRGYECYTASVGPASSAWDRACELYAQLAGGTVDYGAAHAAQHGHARYGRTYEKPLFPGWGKTKSVNLIGHSYGAVTSRLFACLLDAGDKAERAATPKNELSPLFAGKKGNWVRSITTLGGPHNGDPNVIMPELTEKTGKRFPGYRGPLAVLAISALNMPFFNALYDFNLEQWGLTDPPLTVSEKASFLRQLNFPAGTDNALYDLLLHGAHELNQRLYPVPSVYYFSFAGCKTNPGPFGTQLPAYDMLFPYIPNGLLKGIYKTKRPNADGVVVDETWRPNDGLVSVVSALYPFNEAHTDFDPNHIQPGVWNVMPIQRYDHFGFIGGLLLFGSLSISSSDAAALRDFYAAHFAMIEALR